MLTNVTGVMAPARTRTSTGLPQESLPTPAALTAWILEVQARTL